MAVKLSDEKLPDTRKGANSVTGGDGLLHIVIPWHKNHVALPPSVPADAGNYGFNSHRDAVLMSTPKFEAQWASSISTAINRIASMSWEINSDIPLRRKKFHDMLMNFGAGMGIHGWIPGLSVGLRSYFTTGVQIVEIERASGARGARAVALHNLSRSRCFFTGDSQHPIEYLGSDGGSYKIPWHNLIMMIDNMNPDFPDGAIAESAAERAYPQIIKLAAIETFVYEKVSGRRPQAIYFVGGATQSTIQDAIKNAEYSANDQGLTSYMGAAMVPVMGDVPVTIANIPLAELPDGFDAEDERRRADIIYANALGLDHQSVNPQLIGSQGLGSTGNQSKVLNNKEKQSGLSAWRQQFTHQVNMMLLDERTLFAFKEVDFEDKNHKASLDKTNVETAGAMIDKGITDQGQARNWLVDNDTLPVDFIEEDNTAGGSLTDTQKPKDEIEGSEALGKKPEEITLSSQVTEKMINEFNHDEFIDLLRKADNGKIEIPIKDALFAAKALSKKKRNGIWNDLIY